MHLQVTIWITLWELTWHTLIAEINNSVNYARHLLCNENPRTPWEHLPQPPPSYPQPLTTNTFSVPCLSNKHKKWDALYKVSRSSRSGSKRSRVRRYISNTQHATSEEHTRTHSPVDSLDLQMINADTHTNKHTQTINADTRTLMLQPYQMLMSSSSGICITASRSIASTTGPSPQMCVW